MSLARGSTFYTIPGKTKLINKSINEGHGMTESPVDLYNLVMVRREEILAISRHRGVRNVRLFGSVRRRDYRSDSDIDLLVDLEPGRSLLDAGGLAMDLQQLLGCPVDVITEAGLRERIRAKVLEEAQPL